MLSLIISPKYSKANNFASTNLLFTVSRSSVKKNKILFVTINKGELNLLGGGGGWGKERENKENAQTYPKCC